MAKRTRTSDLRNKVEFYKQSEIFDYNSGSYILSWGLEFTSWCRETTIYREQLEASIGGANVLRDRKEFITRYNEKIDTTLRCKYKGKMYEISIVGDTRGDRRETRFLAEATIDGGG